MLRKLYYSKFLIFFRKLYYSFLSIFISFFLTFDDKIPKNEIIVLGRGNSLKKFKKFYMQNKHIKNICIINFNNSDLKDFDISILKKKTIHMFLNSSEPTISFYKLFHVFIGHSYFMRTKNRSKKDRKHFFSNKFGKAISYLPNEFDDLFNTFRNSGLLTIVFVTLFWKPKIIHLFGFDFYQNSMHNKSLRDEFKTDFSINAHVDHGKIMKKQLDVFIKENKNTKFLMHN